MVFQRFNLFPHMTALGNVVEAPIRVRKVSKELALDEGRALLSRVGLSDKCDAYPAQLSGGQQQRVAIARSLVNDPAIVLADEPTGNLDSRTSEDVMSVFQTLNDEGKTIVLITHEPDIAEFARRVVTFRDGKIVADVPGKHRSASLAVAEVAS
jgi:putative ABC transport system ATP-binding protein